MIDFLFSNKKIGIKKSEILKVINVLEFFKFYLEFILIINVIKK